MINKLVYESLNQILEYVDNPKYLYHGSSIQNLKVLGPDSAVTSHDYFESNKKVIPRVYAGDTKLIASAFTFQWNDSMGVEFGTWNGVTKFKIPKKHYHLLKNKCSIYTVSGENFIKPPPGIGLRGEYYSINNVIILKEEKFNSCLDAMKSQNLPIIITNPTSMIVNNQEYHIIELDNDDKIIFCKKYKDCNKNHTIYGLKYNKYIGGIAINKAPNKEIYKKYNLNPNISISWFYIDDTFRSKGLGIKLFEYINSKYSKIALTTGGKSNPESKYIYTKFGFKIIESYKNIDYWYKD